MIKLNFTTRCLGAKAAQRLKDKQVIQTIRSEKSDIVQALTDRTLKLGDTIEVLLDGEQIGMATCLNIDPVKWHNLDIADAQRGGFDNRFELASALKRAGYRFKDMEEYFFWRCLLSWSREGE